VGARTNTYWQTVVVWLLFLASIGTLLFNAVASAPTPGRQESMGGELRQTTLKLVAATEGEAAAVSPSVRPVSGEIDARLEALSERVLGDHPGIEGGFFVNDQADEFAGYAFPTGPRGPHPHKRRDPPPKEEPYIRLQARQSTTQAPGTVVLQTLDVGPSRVMIATSPVGTARPARLVVWLMDRITDPETQRMEVSRYRLSTLLALGGIVTALGLTWNLQRSLRQERIDRERLRDELRRSEHLASLGVLLAKVAHEVRNPLAVIRSTAQLWQRLPQESRTPESLQAVIQAVDRLDALVSQLLYFSRSENTARLSVDLNSVVREACELLRAQAAEQNVRVEVELAADLPQIRGSAPALRQVVLNLATNALQAMSESGRLACRTRHVAANRAVELEIADTGPGVDPSVRDRLFEPFFTTRATGTGLGLALCREIVLQHDGTIELEPAVPHGTVCRIVFPIAESPAS
jgi:two-component system sensor histidine kinase HydH